MIFSLYVINKAGGLIYNTDFPHAAPSTSGGQGDEATLYPPPRLTSNEYLVLAGTFHGVHAITSKISPNTASGWNSGLESLETDTFKLHCFQTLTDPLHPKLDVALHRFYELYADYVMKNPFYTPEMPIRCELFDTNLNKLIRSL